MKKALRITAALCLVASMLVGCGGSGNSTANTSNNANTAADTGGSAADTADTANNTASSGQQVELTFMGWEASPLETESVKNGIALFESENPNIKVVYTPTSGEYAAKLLTMIAGDAGPDCFFMGTGDYASFAKKGVLLDLTDDFYNEYSDADFIPSAMSVMKKDGKIFGVSSCTVNPVLYYNKDIFDKANHSYPPTDPNESWTFEEFRAAAQALTIKNGDKTEQYGAYGLEVPYAFQGFLPTIGAELFSSDMKTFTANTPEVISLLEDLRNIRVVDGSAPSSATLEDIGMNGAQMLQTGKIAMLIDGSWALQELATMNFPVGVAPLPKYKDAISQGQAHVHSAWIGTKSPAEAWKYISFLSSEAYQTDLIKSGLWLPNRVSLYTEEGSKQWYTEEIYGPDFMKMADYIKDSVAQPAAVLGNTEFTTLMTEEMDYIFKSERDIASVMADFEERGNEILQAQ